MILMIRMDPVKNARQVLSYLRLAFEFGFRKRPVGRLISILME